MESVAEMWYDEVIMDYLVSSMEDVVDMWYNEVAIKSNDDSLRRHTIIHIIHALCF